MHPSAAVAHINFERLLQSSKAICAGFVHSVHMYLEDSEYVSFVSVIFDDVDIGFHINSCESNPAIRIGRENREFIFKGRCIVREQFPLQPAWACTIHKVQSASLDRGVTSLGTDIFEKGMAQAAACELHTASL